MDSLVIVDCQYDFIDGTLACKHSHEAVEAIIHFLNTHEVKALYTSDWHRPSNQSFKRNGGIWPDHCVQGTKGAELDSEFSKVEKEENRPVAANRYLKGIADDHEEYSAFLGKTASGEVLKDAVSPHVYVAGIASEFCVRETVLSLLKAGHTVTLLEDGLGYVDQQAHEKNLSDLKARGVNSI